MRIFGLFAVAGMESGRVEAMDQEGLIGTFFRKGWTFG